MVMVKKSNDFLKFIEIEGAESIYLSINVQLKNLFDYLKTYKETMVISDEDEKLLYGNFRSLYQDLPHMADIEVRNSACTITYEPEHFSFEEVHDQAIKNEEDEDEHDEAIRNETRTEYFIKSFVVILCSIFEKNMEKICYKIKQMKSLKLKRKDYCGGLVSSYKKFLKEYGGIASIDKKLWDLLFDIIKIRNMIVHSNLHFIFEDEPPNIKLNGEYSICHGVHHNSDQLYLNWYFCEFSFKIISFFFEQLRWYHLSTLNRDSLYTDENFDVPPKSWSTFYERLLI